MNSDPIFNEHPVLATCGVFQIESEHGGFGDRICTFSVGLRYGLNAWMKILLRQHSDKWVVIVRKRPFLDAWMHTGQEPQLAVGDETVWRNDKKFLNAEKAFSLGRQNPVPLALCDADYRIYRGPPELHTGISDGITRTIWLLANGADRFPVSITSERSARLLYRGAGDKTTEPLSVAFLHSLYRKHWSI
ncbi:plasmid fertility inhibition factor family protein [Pantoea ananatis]|uniref:plasmid fertility inhibition factor family protein n=1 Tax=Pantoea ananas TaxID=553 RepID=UPI003C29B70C